MASPLPYELRDRPSRPRQPSTVDPWATSFSSSHEWPGLNTPPLLDGHNAGLGNWDADITVDSGAEEFAEHRVAEVTRTIARARNLRDDGVATTLITNGNRDRNGTGSTESVALSSSTAARHAVIERLERRRRERTEQGGGPTPSDHAYYPTPANGPATDDGSNGGRHSIDPMISSLPVIVGGDFSDTPSSVTRSASDTLRASYTPSLQRNNSIRRSGFHTLSSSSPLLPRTEQRPVYARMPPRSAIDHPHQDSVRSTLRVISASRNVNTNPSNTSSHLDNSELAGRASAFEDFARASRRASRSARDEAHTNNDYQHPAAAEQRFSFPQAGDPMLASSSADTETISEVLGSSSSVAALEATANSMSRPPATRLISPPGAPIISRRPYPFGPTVPFSTTLSSAEVASSEATSQAIVLRWPSPAPFASHSAVLDLQAALPPPPDATLSFEEFLHDDVTQ